MATDAKLEVTLKFSTLPNAKPAGAGKMAFALRTPNGQFVVAEISNKVWTKLEKAAADWPSWVAALTGTMGERTEKGFVLANPGLQVFERTPKVAADAPAPTANAPTPASPTPAEPAAPPPPPPPPPPAAPVTVTTGVGTATVTKRNPLSLKRNASTEGTPG